MEFIAEDISNYLESHTQDEPEVLKNLIAKLTPKC